MLSFDGHPRDKKQGKKAPNVNPRIQDCLDVFRKPEQLDEENTWYCNKCKDHVQATKTIEIFKAPPIMVLCLQRFKSHNIYFKDKLDDQVDFPLKDLDMSPYTLCSKNGLNQDVSLLYDLYAVSNHYGSLSFGHYTAYCKNPETGKWYDFNDSSVSQVSSESDVVSNSAYVLYYVRKDFFPTQDFIFSDIRIGLKDDTNTVAYHKTQQQTSSSAQSDTQMQEESKTSCPDPQGDQDMITDVDELTGDVILYPKEMKDVVINKDENANGLHANNYQGGHTTVQNIMDYESSEDGDAAPNGYQEGGYYQAKDQSSEDEKFDD